MSVLISLANFLESHKDDLQQIATYEANNRLLTLSIKLNRLRTASEQTALLERHYGATLHALDELDEGFAAQIINITSLLPQSGMTLKDVSDTAHWAVNVLGITTSIDELNINELQHKPLSELPKEHPLATFVEEWKGYYYNELLLSGITDLLDRLQSNTDGEKLSPEQVAPADAKSLGSLTVGQRVLALYFLMRGCGIELITGQGARQHRFMSAITKVSPDEVRKKFPPKADDTYKQSFADNLRVLIPLFEEIGAGKIVAVIQAELEDETRKLVD